MASRRVARRTSRSERTNGVDGRTILNGTTPPGSGLGANGDFYLDTAAWGLYGPKASGAWPTPVAVRGPQGLPGDTGPTGPPGNPTTVPDGAIPQAKVNGLVTGLASKYVKSLAGIPRSDLATSVQSSLDKADTALQSAPVISVNGATGAVRVYAGDPGELYDDPSFAPNDPAVRIPVVKTCWGIKAAKYTCAVGSELVEFDDPYFETAGNPAPDEEALFDPVSLEWSRVTGPEVTEPLDENNYYVLPSGGIPKTDLEQAVQNTLVVADAEPAARDAAIEATLEARRTTFALGNSETSDAGSPIFTRPSNNIVLAYSGAVGLATFYWPSVIRLEGRVSSPEAEFAPALGRRQRLRVAIDHAKVGLQRPADDGLVKRDAVWPGVQRDDGEIALGYGEQLGELAVGRPAVPDRANTVDVAQEPADAEGVAEGAATQRDSRLLHLMQHLHRQHADTAFRVAVTEMEPGPAQLFRHRGREARAGVVAAPMPVHRNAGKTPVTT